MTLQLKRNDSTVNAVLRKTYTALKSRKRRTDKWVTSKFRFRNRMFFSSSAFSYSFSVTNSRPFGFADLAVGAGMRMTHFVRTGKHCWNKKEFYYINSYSLTHRVGTYLQSRQHSDFSCACSKHGWNQDVSAYLFIHIDQIFFWPDTIVLAKCLAVQMERKLPQYRLFSTEC